MAALLTGVAFLITAFCLPLRATTSKVFVASHSLFSAAYVHLFPELVAIIELLVMHITSTAFTRLRPFLCSIILAW